jgi:hypothetical protein
VQACQKTKTPIYNSPITDRAKQTDMFPKIVHRLTMHQAFQCHPLFTATRRTVQLSVVLILLIITQVNANGYSQPTVSLSKTNATLTAIFKDIEGRAIIISFSMKAFWRRRVK